MHLFWYTDAHNIFRNLHNGLLVVRTPPPLPSLVFIFPSFIGYNTVSYQCACCVVVADCWVTFIHPFFVVPVNNLHAVAYYC